MMFRFIILSSRPDLGKTVPSHKGLWKQSKTMDALTIEEAKILEHIGIFSGWYQKRDELLRSCTEAF